MSEVNSTSPHGAHPGVLSDTPTECITQNVNYAYVPSLPNPTLIDITCFAKLPTFFLYDRLNIPDLIHFSVSDFTRVL